MVALEENMRFAGSAAAILAVVTMSMTSATTTATAATIYASACKTGSVCVYGYPDYSTPKLTTGTINRCTALPGSSGGQPVRNLSRYEVILYAGRSCDDPIRILPAGDATPSTSRIVRSVKLVGDIAAVLGRSATPKRSPRP